MYDVRLELPIAVSGAISVQVLVTDWHVAVKVVLNLTVAFLRRRMQRAGHDHRVSMATRGLCCSLEELNRIPRNLQPSGLRTAINPPKGLITIPNGNQWRGTITLH